MQRALALCGLLLFGACGDSQAPEAESPESVSEHEAGGAAPRPDAGAFQPGQPKPAGAGGRASAANGGRPAAPPSAGRRSEPQQQPPDAGPPPADDSDADVPDPGEPETTDTRGEMLTQRYDNARTGANLQERTLSPANVRDLKLLGSWSVDGEIYAQVLVAAGVETPLGKRSVAIVATMNDSVYGFDADATPADAFLWQRGRERELGSPGFCARNVGGANGILSTPVIDKQRGHVFVLARDCDPRFPPEMPVCEQRLIQLDLQTGALQESLPVRGAVMVAAADGGEVKPLEFEPSTHWNRPGLLLAGDELIVAFGSGPAGDQHEEDFVYHGWVFRYDVRDLKRAPDVYCTTPRGRGGSVWQAGAAPAADDQGIYFTGANGIQADGKVHPPNEWPSVPTGQEDSLIRLPRSAPFPTPQSDVQQFWDARPYTSAGNVFQHMESGDNGFGSSGPMLIPDSPLLISGTKAGLVYLLNRETLQAVQEPLSPFTDLALQPGHTLYLHSWWGIPMTTQAFVFWRPQRENTRRFGFAYAWPSNDRLRQLSFDYEQSQLQLTATADVPAVLGGGNMVLSAAGDAAASGVLWAATRSDTGTSGPSGVLWAFDPLTLEVLWRTSTPAWSKFNPPTVVRGRVFVPSTSNDPTTSPQVLVYGLAN